VSVSGGGTGVFVGRGVIVGRGVLVGGTEVLVGRGVFVAGGTAVLVGSGVLVEGGTGVGVKVFLSLERFVIVGIMITAEEGDTAREGVVNTVGEKVSVKTGKFGGSVSVTMVVGVPVAVIKSVAKACIVNARSVLAVGVIEPPPLFGMMRSASFIPRKPAPETMKGSPTAMTQVAKKTSRSTYFTFFTWSRSLFASS
jgi:hypothetical protein